MSQPKPKYFDFKPRPIYRQTVALPEAKAKVVGHLLHVGNKVDPVIAAVDSFPFQLRIGREQLQISKDSSDPDNRNIILSRFIRQHSDLEKKIESLREMNTYRLEDMNHNIARRDEILNELERDPDSGPLLQEELLRISSIIGKHRSELAKVMDSNIVELKFTLTTRHEDYALKAGQMEFFPFFKNERIFWNGLGVVSCCENES